MKRRIGPIAAKTLLRCVVVAAAFMAAGTATGGVIQATVRDAQTLQPVPGVSVTIAREFGGSFVIPLTDANGVVRVLDLPVGNYFVCAIDPTDVYRDECRDGTQLAIGQSYATSQGVLLFDGDEIQLAIDLDRGAQISGTITDNYFQVPLTGFVSIQLFPVTGGDLWANVLATSSGGYTIAGLAPGQYRIAVQGGESDRGYTRKLYPDITCGPTCDFQQGGVIALAPLQSVDGIDFSLHPQGIATGVVREAGSNQPLAGVPVVAYEQGALGVYIVRSRGVTNALGQFTLAHIRPSNGIRFGTEATTHVNASWPVTPCFVAPCAAGSDNAFTIDQMRGGFDFTLARSGAIQGTVANARGQAQSATVVIRSADNSIFTYASTTLDRAAYSSLGLPAGTYYAAAANNVNGTNYCSLWHALACGAPPNIIDFATATPIVVGTAAPTGGIDFLFDFELLRDGFE